MQPGTPPEQVPALRERVAAARLTQRQAMGATGEASSGDGRVRAVVDATGVVTSLTFTPSVFDDTTPAKLAITVVATIQAAAAKARAQVTEAMAPIRADSEQARAGVAGIPELRGLNSGVPDVPTTAIDPTVQQAVWEEPARREPPPPDENDENPGSVFTDTPW